ncbi:protein of unknown function [Candidatus Nitrosocosmicus franklandus]|uniref:Uncharacterized protein n=1 Tax=Candidatus Nitrosocosmicus franklandianus TaxID=1798806 RepID=A0A484I7C5_9ARCH|nr:protein of unknown function [Candidatus Nitrosocosmicus franklandus]
MLKFEVCNLTSRRDILNLTNLAKKISASADEEGWLEIVLSRRQLCKRVHKC